MTKKRFYQLSLLLPLVLPLLLLPFEPAGPLLLASLAFGGVPYLACAVLLLYLSLSRDSRFFEKVGWFLPPLFGIFVGLFWFVYSAFSTPSGFEGWSFKSLGKSMLVFAIYSCAFGYFYVVLVRLLGYAFWSSEKS